MQKIIDLFLTKPLFVLLLLVIPSFISIVRPGFFPMHDDLQAFRIHQMNECFSDLQFPCRWVPDMGYQYGYPQYNFYPPFPYYLGEAFHLLSFQFIDSVKILFAVGFIVSALAMYLLLQSFLGRWVAVAGALLYTYIPYKAVNVYVRGAMNEFWAMAIYPLLFWSSYKIIKNGGKRNIAFFAISLALLLTTHNLMALIFFPVLGIWVLTQIILEKKYRSLIPLTIAGFLGIGLAAFFTGPVFFEKQYAHLESLVGGYFDYRQHFVSLQQMFLYNNWGYGSSLWGNDDGLSLSAGHIQILGWLIALVLAIVGYKKHQKLSIIVFVFSLVELLTLFMIHQKSSFVWTAFESFLIYLQFPWRFYSTSSFLVCLLASIGIYFITKLDIRIFKLKAAAIYGTVLVIACLILYLPFFHPFEWYNITDKEKFSGVSWDKQLTISIFDYLPIYAKFPPTSPAPKYPETLEGLADFKSYTRESDSKRWRVYVSEDALLRAPMFDFPGMKVFIDSQLVDHWNDDCRNEEFCHGLITFKIPQGEHEIFIKLTNTPLRAISNLITILSIFVVLILLAPNFKYFKKWLD